VIEFRNVTKSFGTGAALVHAVNDLSFAIDKGAFWALMGPSGSGKSTVLHLIAGLTPPTSGTIVVDGMDIAGLTNSAAAELRRRHVGYVLQSFNLLPFLTAEENIGMPLILDGVKQREVSRRVAEALELVSMAQRAQHKPSELSGGEQQRIAIARALVIQPSIILADEPTGNLDRANGMAVMGLIEEVNSKTGVTILMVTHDPLFAAQAHRVLRMVDGRLDQLIELPEEDAEALSDDA